MTGSRPPRLASPVLSAYRRTAYTAAGITVHIGRRSAAVDALLARHGVGEGVFITAFNPFSRRMPAGWNRRMQSRLMEFTRSFVVFPAQGSWRGWTESHVLVLANRPRMLVLARRYRQHGIVILRARQPAKLGLSYLED
jgi:hypothetical protein